MKAFLKYIPAKLRNFNKVVDAKTNICDKSWVVLNDGQSKESYIFRNNGDLILTRNGIATIGHYSILPADKILIDIEGTNYLFNPLISNSAEILALKLDGSEQYSFLIDEQCKLFEIVKYYDDFEKMLLAEEKRQIEKEKRVAEKIENQKKQKFYDQKGLGKSYTILTISIILVFISWVGLPYIFLNTVEELYGVVLAALSVLIVPVIALIIYLKFDKQLTKKEDKCKIEKLLTRNDLSSQEREWLLEYYKILM